METPNQHLPDDRIAAMRRRTLPPEELIAASRHLRECAECRARVESSVATAAAARALQQQLASERADSPHLDFESQLMPYTEGRLANEELADTAAHLEHCATCRAEVDDLREFRREMGSRPRPSNTRWLVAAAALAAAIAIAFVLMRPRATSPQHETPVIAVTPAMSVALRDGGAEVGLDATGKLHGTNVESAWATIVAGALRNPDLEQPKMLRTLSGVAHIQRGSTGESPLSLREPLGVVVESDRPTFRWDTELPGARYEVAVFDEAGHMVAHGATRELEWQPVSPLRRGATYLWQVRAVKNEREVVAPAPDQPEARFAVLRADVAAGIAAARARNEGHLVPGLLYFNGGAIAEARKEFAALAAENPQSAVAQRLLASTTR